MKLTNLIAFWSGSIATIPSGWLLCDGNNGTPDLRDQFQIAAGETYDPDDTGGSSTHTHGFTGDGHFHTLPPFSPKVISVGTDYDSTTSSDPAVGTTDPGSSIPPFKALLPIMIL